MSEFRKLIRWCVGLLALVAGFTVIDAAAGTGASFLVGLALCATVLLCVKGARVCDELDAAEDELEAVWLLPSYRPLEIEDVRPWRERGEAS